MNIPISLPPYPIPPDHKELPDRDEEVAIGIPPTPPGHKDLPDSDGAIVINFQERPQMGLLTDTIKPVLQRLHPDGHFVIGTDNGIYWRLTDPPLNGCKAPDWFYVPNRPQLLDGEIRRSYVLWREGIAPLIVMEFVSRDGSEEHDRTPLTGKFWVYEQGIRVPYYAIFDGFRETLEVYHAVDGRYQPLPANERGHYPIPPLGVELGLWHGGYEFHGELTWLRWYDAAGNLLPTPQDQRDAEREAKDDAQRKADDAQRKADDAQRKADDATEKSQRLAEKLRSLGINPDEV